MAKGQQRSSKQQKKPKTAEKKPAGPKYLRQSELLQAGTLGAQRSPRKPAPKQ